MKFSDLVLKGDEACKIAEHLSSHETARTNGLMQGSLSPEDFFNLPASRDQASGSSTSGEKLCQPRSDLPRICLIKIAP